MNLNNSINALSVHFKLSPKGLCPEGLVTYLWCYCELVEPLGVWI